MTNDELAAAGIRAMERRNCVVRRGKGETNILSVEGVNLDGSPNDNAPNKFTDLRLVIRFEGGKPVIAGKWECTTIAGKVYTELRPLNPDGAAMIALGQQRVWKVDMHRGNHLAWCQRAGSILVTRDKNKDYKRTGDKHYKGDFGINMHGGYDFPKDDIKTASAGCGVIAKMVGHQEFMRLTMADPAYVADNGYVAYATVIEASELRPDAPVPAKIDPSKVVTVLDVTADAWRKIFPAAPEAIIASFVDRQVELHVVGITTTRTRLGQFCANVEHEVGGWTIKNLTENINYSHERVAAVWPNRYSSGAAVRAKFGAGANWQLKMFDEIYGGRMGNRPGTNDGSTYIGRAGPQITGREAYAEIGKRTGLALESSPDLATKPQSQPAICAQFWDWKKLNQTADVGDFDGTVKRWNGGRNGMQDRVSKLAGNDPYINGLVFVKTVMPVLKSIPGGPSTPTPPKDIVDAATENERKARNGGATAAGAGGASEGAKAATEQPGNPGVGFLPPVVAWTLIGVGIVVVVVAIVLIARKKAAVISNWF